MTFVLYACELCLGSILQAENESLVTQAFKTDSLATHPEKVNYFRSFFNRNLIQHGEGCDVTLEDLGLVDCQTGVDQLHLAPIGG